MVHCISVSLEILHRLFLLLLQWIKVPRVKLIHVETVVEDLVASCWFYGILTKRFDGMLWVRWDLPLRFVSGVLAMAHVAVSMKLGSPFVGVLVVRALLLRVHIRAPEVWKLTYDHINSEPALYQPKRNPPTP